MNRIVYILSVLNALSVDVVAGAMIGMAFFADRLDVSLKGFIYLVMGSTVWMIYTVDHLLDARRIRKDASTFRHRFHQRHFTTLLVAVLIIGLTNGIVLLTTLRPFIVPGGSLIFLVALYFLAHSRLHGVKELAGAFLYTLGIALPSIVLAFHWPRLEWVIIGGYLLVAWMNLLIFSLTDRLSDEKDGMSSFARLFGTARTRMVVILIYTGLIVICAVLMVMSEMSASLVLFGMGTVLLILAISKQVHGKTMVVRLLGDSVFYMPLIYLLT